MTRKMCVPVSAGPLPSVSLLAGVRGLVDREPADVDPRSTPCSTMSKASSRSVTEMSRLRARRLPVPRGSSAMGLPESAMPWATARTVPSPPTATTTSAPRSRASRVWPRPGSSTVVSTQIGSGSPSAVQRDMSAALSCSAPFFEGFATKAS